MHNCKSSILRLTLTLCLSATVLSRLTLTLRKSRLELAKMEKVFTSRISGLPVQK